MQPVSEEKFCDECRVALSMDLNLVRRVIAQLPEPDRAALVLRADQSLPYTEIARILEISEGAARVKVYRARRRLLNVYLATKEVGDGSDP
jgi:RNA polymerase sigma factor (sigma-70 family)